jgi:hypothetical protein
MRRRRRERGTVGEGHTTEGSLVFAGGGFEEVVSASLLSVVEPEGVARELGKLTAVSSFGDSISIIESGEGSGGSETVTASPEVSAVVEESDEGCTSRMKDGIIS